MDISTSDTSFNLFFLLSREELNSKVLPEQSIFEAHGDIKLSGTMPIPRGRKLYWPGCSN